MKTANNSAAATSFPRGIPFRPPQELQAQAARLRRWTIILVAASAVVLVAAIAAFVYFKNQGNAPSSPVVATPAGATPESAAPAEDAAAVAEKSAAAPAALPKLTLPKLPVKELKPAAASSTVPPKTDAKSMDSKHRDRLLEAVGGLSAVHLYQSYLNIGLVADAVESEAYTKTDAASLLQTIGELVILVDNHLGQVAQIGLDEGDQQAIERIRNLATLLRVQSNSLLGYWATGEMEHVDRYHEAREQTWDDLKELLGIEE